VTHMTDGRGQAERFSDARYTRAATDFMDVPSALPDLGPLIRRPMVGSSSPAAEVRGWK